MRILTASLWATALAATSCFSPTVNGNDCAYTCTSACPDGLTCVNGECRVNPDPGQPACGSGIDAAVLDSPAGSDAPSDGDVCGELPSGCKLLGEGSASIGGVCFADCTINGGSGSADSYGICEHIGTPWRLANLKGNDVFTLATTLNLNDKEHWIALENTVVAPEKGWAWFVDGSAGATPVIGIGSNADQPGAATWIGSGTRNGGQTLGDNAGILLFDAAVQQNRFGAENGTDNLPALCELVFSSSGSG